MTRIGSTVPTVGPLASDHGPPGGRRLLSTLVIGSLRELHEGWAWFVIIGNGLAGAWALSANWIEPLRTRALWWFTVFAQVSMFVQVGLGVGMVAGQNLEVAQFHMFYGFVAIIAIAILYSYRDQLRPRLYLLYGFGGLFVMGLSIRALLVVDA